MKTMFTEAKCSSMSDMMTQVGLVVLASDPCTCSERIDEYIEYVYVEGLPMTRSVPCCKHIFMHY